MNSDEYLDKLKAECTVDGYTREWVHKIPAIALPEGFKFIPSPNYAGSVARFRVQIENTERTLSVYLDCYDRLGCFGEPYWELYPYKEETFRCAMNDVGALEEAILEAAKEII